MKLAVIGATGLVGREMITVLKEYRIKYSQLILAASEKSAGKIIDVSGAPIEVCSISTALNILPDIALFSAGKDVSLEWAPKFAEKNVFVIDNSSAWRMDSKIKLVVPEINGHTITYDDKIIANPNCSTIQLVMALAPLHKKYGINRVVVSTYQSVSGSGARGLQQLENERTGKKGAMKYPYNIDQNCIPQCDDFIENGYTKEEMKVINETKKILNDQNIAVTCTAVRVPVTGGHSESVNIELKKGFELNEVRNLLDGFKGIKVVDTPEDSKYPMPIFCRGKDDVFVGRIRRDESKPNSLNMWIVSDNLRKGAATNAVQIGEMIIGKFVKV